MDDSSLRSIARAASGNIAHELGMGYIARPTSGRSPAFSDVAHDGGRGLLRADRPDHAIARLEKSVANGALNGDPRCSPIGIAVASHPSWILARRAAAHPAKTRSASPVGPVFGRRSSLRRWFLRGDVVLWAACEERVLFSSGGVHSRPAVTYAASQIARLTVLGRCQRRGAQA